MSELSLVIGNKNYSSWSLRAWLCVRRVGQDFQELPIWFQEDLDRSQRLGHAPHGKVPVLKHGDRTIWDTLAIGEYLAETFPDSGLWPKDPGERALARCLCAEMHSGFQAVRNSMPMNCRMVKETCDRGDDVAQDIHRLTQIFEGAGTLGSGGPYYFGEYGLIDAYFTPVASRFRTYSIPLSPKASAYRDALLNHEYMKEWSKEASKETQKLDLYDAMP